MQLFETEINKELNLLPYNGTVNYYGKLFSKELADKYYNYLFNEIQWENDKALIFGKLIITKRKVAWYAAKEFDYTYSKITKQSLLFTKELLELKYIVEEQTKEKYNSCLLNLYHNGNEAMAWHSDAEKELKPNGAIASLSFGAERKFSFKHKVNKTIVSQILEHGSLLVMKEETQLHWLHRLPPTTKIKTARISLTFRTMMN